ncbi:MAG: hypothetical protein ABI674_11550 [Spartobacteria bacterium]
MFSRTVNRGQRIRFLFVFLAIIFTLATCLTLFYFVHEQLPRLARAPSALLLVPVAMVDGLCYAAGIPGIYGKVIPILIVNSVFAAILCRLGYLAARLWRHRNI